MENTENNSKKLYLIIAGALVVILLAAVYWFMQDQEVALPTAGSVPPSSMEKPDSTQAIAKDLNAVDVGDTEKEFMGIDKDIQGL